MAILAPRSSHFSNTFFDKKRKEDSDIFFEELVSPKKFLLNVTILQSDSL